MPSPAHRVALLHLRTKRQHNRAFQKELDALNESTVAAVRALGWTADLVASAERPTADTLQAARAADMVVVMGGEDVDPRLYGDIVDYPGSGNHEPRADSAQIAVILEAMQHRRPLLGICRGHQLLNVALGGTLIQHLSPGDPHRGTTDPADPFTPMRIRLGAGGDLHRDVDASQRVLCTHHQAIAELGHGLRAVAHSSDGLVEAVAHERAPLTGVQWHPEHPHTAQQQLTPLLRRMERQLAEKAQQPALKRGLRIVR